MRLAALDIGSNSIHLQIARILPDHSWEIVYRDKSMVRLGSRSFARGELTVASRRRALRTLERYAQVMRKFEVGTIVAVATSAVREATNGAAFLREVRSRTGLKVDRISGAEEARLVAIAVGSVPPFDTGRHLVIDIGGGSTELAFLENQEPRSTQSYKVGCVRMAEEFPLRDRPGRKAFQEVRTAIRGRMGLLFRSLKGRKLDGVAGTSGTAVSLGMLAARRQGLPVVKGRTFAVPNGIMRRELDRLAGMSLAERREYMGEQAGRADVILHGGAILIEILDALENEEILIPDRSIRDGMILDHVRQRLESTPEDHALRLVRMADGQPDAPYDPRTVRERALVAFARRYNYEAGHAHHVMELAAQLFDATKRVHGYGDEEKFYLEAAALLHDIGQHIAYSQHHKHSLYLILNSGMPGFHDREIQVIGNVARYHRKAFPSMDHPDYAALGPDDRRLVKRLAALLRIADGLDSGHLGSVKRVAASLKGSAVKLRLTGVRDMDAERERAAAKADLFEDVFERSVQFEASRGSRRALTAAAGR